MFRANGELPSDHLSRPLVIALAAAKAA